MTMTRVAICVPTYRRNDQLALLLHALDELQFEDETPAIEIVIIDNADDRAAEPVARAHAQRSRWSVRYVHEPTRGLAHVRNAALDAVLQETITPFTHLAFIDDDETPDPRWLSELLRVQREFKLDAVGGPVLAEFPVDAPQWAIHSGMWHRRRYPTGALLPHLFTNNLLLSVPRLCALGIRFDPRFNRTGKRDRQFVGEDRHFIAALRISGGRVGWADEAIVHEPVPLDRLRLRWLWRRSLCTGMSSAISDRLLCPGFGTWCNVIARAGAWMLIGLLRMPASVAGPMRAASAIKSLGWGIGLLQGAFASLRDGRRS